MRSPYALVAPTVVALVFMVTMIATGNARLHPVSSEGDPVASAAEAVQAASQDMAYLWKSLASGAASLVPNSYSGQAMALSDASQAPEEPPASSVIPPDDAGKVAAEHAGLVVMPSQGSSTDQAKLDQSIQDSFSDTVVVKPNADGTTGVIQPVFRTVAGHDFLYVLVPVKAASSTSAAN